ncbi:hypothetical protein PYW08_007211 [Mythimna loreyi]|uniref:Uncharacterized protein n=1 Tax=Mythimna loreyi TaxID=667449 RepID=A0ACC2R9T4_9NEOP|nr:hypothetical protein PYW08_007211 [Mythimna loreyi]
MMRILFLVMLPLAWSYGEPNTQGGGAFAFVDSAGNRYGGTYGLKNGRVVSTTGDAFPQHLADQIPFQNFADNIPFQNFADFAYPGGEDFGQAYFSNLENLLQEVFNKNLESQKLALNAARKAFDLTSNQPGGYAGGYSGGFSGGYSSGYPEGYSDYSGGYYPNPNIASRFPAFPSFPAFTMPRPTNFGNSAFASAVAGPGYQHHVASINPGNPRVPNVDETINHYSDYSAPGNGFYSVSSKSFSSSSNLNGKEVSNRGAETVVNDNGKITQYKVHS